MTAPSRVDVPTGLHLQSRFFAATRSFWRAMGNLESAVLREDIEDLEIRQPLYVCSLARAGTTIVTELLERHPDVTSHHYSDFPNVWTPYWRNDLLARTRRETPERIERAHGDRIRVNNDSPEAVEEILWMAWFSGLHDPGQDNVLHDRDENAPFDRFYRDHIRKLLAVRKASRYLAKGNYNVSRLEYIIRLFPDARFVIPVRDPATHVASLAKQHRRFVEAHEYDSRVGRQLSLAGHFEFGPFRTCVNFGDADESARIIEAWSNGREVEGWARYWATTYRYLASAIETSPALARACLLFRYEDLCRHSEPVIDRLLDHCALKSGVFSEHRAEYSQRLSLPDYYDPGLDEADLRLIGDLCGGARNAIDRLSWSPA